MKFCEGILLGTDVSYDNLSRSQLFRGQLFLYSWDSLHSGYLTCASLANNVAIDLHSLNKVLQ